MRAVVVEGASLRLRDDVKAPVPAAGEVLIDVRAVGVNKVDPMRKASHFEAAETGPAIAGIEVAGVVAENGPGAVRWPVGTRMA